MEFLMRSGRAVLFPVYQGTFERRPKKPLEPGGQKDQFIRRCKDLQRSLDYLATRPDIAHDRLGLFAISNGAHTGLFVLPFEPRIRVAVLADMGFPVIRKPPELDDINFVPRVRVPVLMLNGRDDLLDPMETNQLPLFHLLGTPDKDKRHVLFDRGHRGPTQEYVKETLDWLDRYLGAVNTKAN